MTQEHRIIAVSGELGAGKSAVTRLLASRLGWVRVSTGDAQRRVAEELGISILALNALAESDPTVDTRIDEAFGSFDSSPTVVDSRLAWHFLPDSMSVHLLVDPVIGAERVVGRGPSSSEEYGSVDEAVVRIEERVSIERRRFRRLYNVDIADLRNYDLVIDTSEATPETVAEAVIQRLLSPKSSGPEMLLAPQSIRPTEDAVPRLGRSTQSALVEAVRSGGTSVLHPIEVAYAEGTFFIIQGHESLSAAILNRLPLIPAKLIAQDDDRMAGGLSAKEYCRSESRPSYVFNWEDAHGFRFKSDPYVSRA